MINRARISSRGGLGAFFGLLALTHPLWAADIRVVTEYIYPTSYDVTPITQTGPNGNVRIVGAIVIPQDFETREVGTIMSVYAAAAKLGGVAGMTNGKELINGNTDLMIAATAGDYRAAKRLIARGADVNAQNKFGSSALLGAATGGFEKIVDLLLARDANPKAASSSGATPLMVASRNGHLPVVKTLIQKGVDVNQADAQGLTPLMYAIHGGHTAVANTLLAHGAHVDSRDRDGATPLMMARNGQHRDIVVLLTRLGAKE